jgi:hypothetical protein
MTPPHRTATWPATAQLGKDIQRSDALLSDPDVSRHGLEAIWCTRSTLVCTAQLIAVTRRLDAPGTGLDIDIAHTRKAPA